MTITPTERQSRPMNDTTDRSHDWRILAILQADHDTATDLARKSMAWVRTELAACLALAEWESTMIDLA